MRLGWRGVVVHHAVLSMALVVATALALGAGVFLARGQQVERDADRRVAEGAALLQTSLVETRDEIRAVGDALQRDRAFATALSEHRWSVLEERLELVLQPGIVNQCDIADPRGVLLRRIGRQRGLDAGATVAAQPGFQQAITGTSVVGFAYDGDGPPRHDAYVPIRASERTAPIGVMRLSAFLDEASLERLRRRTGLDVSIFVGDSLAATTLPAGSGLLRQQVVAAHDAIVTGGGEAAWQGLLSRPPRAQVVPLNDPSGRMVGTLVTSLPVGATTSGLGELLALSLPVVLATILGGIALAYLLARRIQEPVLALAEAAARMRDGDFLTPMPALQEPELTPLAQELERARSRIHVTLRTIADAEMRQRALFSALHEPVLTTSAEGKITSFNAAAVGLLGDPVRLYGQRLDKLLPFVNVAARPGEESRWQGHISTPTGLMRDVEVIRTRVSTGTFPLTDIYVVHDVSEYVELGRMREQLLYSVAHEVRGPLGILDNVLDILAHDHEDVPASELGRLARSARSTVARLHIIVESLLSAGSIQAGRFQVQPAPISLALIVDEGLQAALPLIEAREQRTEQQLPAKDRHVLADQRYIRQLLWNLLSNASKYSPDGALIRIRAEALHGVVRVTVQDYGRGIPVEQQAGLFERFYRAQSVGTSEGIGLGLAIAKTIVDAHGGSIGVESAPGEGTRVWFTLPVLAEPTA